MHNTIISTNRIYFIFESGTRNNMVSKRLMKDLDLRRSLPIPSCVDDTPTIKMSDKFRPKTKHVDVKFNCVRHLKKSEILELENWGSKYISTDVLTKPFPKPEIEWYKHIHQLKLQGDMRQDMQWDAQKTHYNETKYPLRSRGILRALRYSVIKSNLSFFFFSQSIGTFYFFYFLCIRTHFLVEWKKGWLLQTDSSPYLWTKVCHDKWRRNCLFDVELCKYTALLKSCRNSIFLKRIFSNNYNLE